MTCEVGLQLLVMVLDELLEWTNVRGLSFICSLYASHRHLIFETMGVLGLSLYFVCQLQDVTYAKVCVQLGIL